VKSANGLSRSSAGISIPANRTVTILIPRSGESRRRPSRRNHASGINHGLLGGDCANCISRSNAAAAEAKAARFTSLSGQDEITSIR
jgi:hypothetical protein